MRVHILAPASLVVGCALVLSGCQSVQGVLDSLGGAPSSDTSDTTGSQSDSTGDSAAEAETNAPQVEENTQEPTTPTTVQAAVPRCSTLYSDSQVVAFEEEGRQSEGDISQDGYGYGTTNQDLIALLEGVRSDLRVSCTWYLPPEFSSTTSVAILGTKEMGAVEDILSPAANSQATLGSGSLWKIETSSSNISGEYTANEAHFITATECPESLAETNCSIWIASTNSSGSSEELTRDSAIVFGALSQ
ncbi:MAG: hypothetical protein WD400_03790 [Pontimonas sp.]